LRGRRKRSAYFHWVKRRNKSKSSEESRLDSFCVEPIRTNGVAVNDVPMSGWAYTRHTSMVDLTEFQLRLLGHFFGEGTTMTRVLPAPVILCPTVPDVCQCDSFVVCHHESNVRNDPKMCCSFRAFVGHVLVPRSSTFVIFGCVSYQGSIVLMEWGL
jgi:hypothetical protein